MKTVTISNENGCIIFRSGNTVVYKANAVNYSSLTKVSSDVAPIAPIVIPCIVSDENNNKFIGYISIDTTGAITGNYIPTYGDKYSDLAGCTVWFNVTWVR